MLSAIRTARTQPPILFSIPLPYRIGRSTSGLGFRRTATGTSHPQNDDNMEQQKRREEKEQTKNSSAKTGNVMSHSFGEGYATRSDEEGFGGIYGGNDPISSEELEKTIHENHPDYDKSQGSEVKEKEKGRHQKSVGC
ncbi:hypothetical protein U1Q18_011704 [Sarracenia purpurea var. burkii]